MSNLVQRIHKQNNVSRNVFDISNSTNFVTCAGQLLPVRFDDVLPNSEFRFNQSYFLRTLPLVVPSFARIKVHFDNFFVPYRLLGTDVQSIIVGNNRGMISNYSSTGTFSNNNKSLPYVPVVNLNPNTHSWDTTLQDAAGYSQSVSSRTLLNSLGYGVPITDEQFTPKGVQQASAFGSGNEIASSAHTSIVKGTEGNTTTQVNSIAVSILPLLAYQKIYQDFYRNKLWENENRNSYFLQTADYGTEMNVNTMLQRGILEMRYHDYDKDRVTGMVPDVSNILSAGLATFQASAGSDNLDYSLGTGLVPKSQYGYPVSSDESFLDHGLTALSLRRLEAFQKFAEICDINKSDYKHQVKAHFGFDVNDLNSDYCQYLGGFEDILNVSDVENTTSTQAAALSGKGTSQGSSRQFSYRAPEHGMIMTICYIIPEVDYSNLFVDRAVTRLNRYDFAIPEFDSIGFEPVRLMDVVSPFTNLVVGTTSGSVPFGTEIVGYLPRYWSYKTKLDVAYPPFYKNVSKEESLNYESYIIQYPYKRFYQKFNDGLMYQAFKCTPDITDVLFPVAYGGNIENSPFVVNFYDNCSAMLPLSVSGLPY